MKTVHIDKEKLRGSIWGKREAVAQALGLRPNSVTRKLHGDTRLTLEDLNIFARVLKRDATEFLIIRDEPPVQDTDGIG